MLAPFARLLVAVALASGVAAGDTLAQSQQPNLEAPKAAGGLPSPQGGSCVTVEQFVNSALERARVIREAGGKWTVDLRDADSRLIESFSSVLNSLPQCSGTKSIAMPPKASKSAVEEFLRDILNGNQFRIVVGGNRAVRIEPKEVEATDQLRLAALSKELTELLTTAHSTTDRLEEIKASIIRHSPSMVLTYVGMLFQLLFALVLLVGFWRVGRNIGGLEQSVGDLEARLAAATGETARRLDQVEATIRRREAGDGRDRSGYLRDNLTGLSDRNPGNRPVAPPPRRPDVFASEYAQSIDKLASAPLQQFELWAAKASEFAAFRWVSEGANSYAAIMRDPEKALVDAQFLGVPGDNESWALFPGYDMRSSESTLGANNGALAIERLGGIFELEFVPNIRLTTVLPAQIQVAANGRASLRQKGKIRLSIRS